MVLPIEGDVVRVAVRPRWVILAATAAAALVVLGVAGLVRNAPDQPRAREYTSKRACLLTDDGGVATAPASAVWQGMQDASASTRAQVSFQAMAPGSTTAEALPYLNGMIEQNCEVIVTVGDDQAGAAEQAAGTNLTVHFIVVGSDAKPAANVKTLLPGQNLRGQVKGAVKDFTSP